MPVRILLIILFKLTILSSFEITATSTTSSTFSNAFSFSGQNKSYLITNDFSRSSSSSTSSNVKVIDTYCKTYRFRCLTISFVLGVIILCTIVGNAFVIAAVILERNLHNVANFLIVSLAVADLMVASMVMPIAAYQEVTNFWGLGNLVCDIWTSFDVLCCTASILHLVAIALDRYLAISKVDYGAKRTTGRIITTIACIWFVSTIISILPHVFGLSYKNHGKQQQYCQLTDNLVYQLFSTLGAFYLPLTVMCIIYWKIFQAAKFRIRKKAFNRPNVDMVKAVNNSNNNLNNTTTTSTSNKNQPNTINKQLTLVSLQSVNTNLSNSPKSLNNANGTANGHQPVEAPIEKTTTAPVDANNKSKNVYFDHKEPVKKSLNLVDENKQSVDTNEESNENKTQQTSTESIESSVASTKVTRHSLKDILLKKRNIFKSLRQFNSLKKPKIKLIEATNTNENNKTNQEAKPLNNDLKAQKPNRNESLYSIIETDKLIKNMDLENNLLNDIDNTFKMYIDSNLNDSNLSMFNSNSNNLNNNNLKSINVPIAIQESDSLDKSSMESVSSSSSSTASNNKGIKYSLSINYQSGFDTNNDKIKESMPLSKSYDFQTSHDVSSKNSFKLKEKLKKLHKNVPKPLDLKDITTKINYKQCEEVKEEEETKVGDKEKEIKNDTFDIVIKPEINQNDATNAANQTKIVPKSVTNYSIANASPTPTIKSFQTQMNSSIKSGKTQSNSDNKKSKSAKTNKRNKIDIKRERKAAKTLGIIMSCFILCWLPFFIMQIIKSICKECSVVLNEHPIVITLLTWLGYMNSLLNPMIYTVFSPDFRDAFAKILFGKYRRKKKIFY